VLLRVVPRFFFLGEMFNEVKDQASDLGLCVGRQGIEP
jgi:hypothetical protein